MIYERRTHFRKAGMDIKKIITNFQKKYAYVTETKVPYTHVCTYYFYRYAKANCVNPDQTAPRSSLIRVYTICYFIAMLVVGR